MRVRNELLSSLAGAAMIVTTIACAPDEQTETDAWQGERLSRDGVEVVHNPGSPLLESSEVEVTQLWNAPAPVEEAATGPWEQPTVVRATADWVYVLDPMAHRVYLVGADSGTWSRSVGQQGSGPGELDRPYGIALVGSNLVVGNQGAATLEIFDASGEYVNSLTIGEVGFQLEAVGDRLFVNSFLGRESAWKLVDIDGVTEMFDWPEPSEPLGEAFDECSRASTASAMVVRVSCYRPVLQMVDTSGTSHREIVVDQPPIEVDDSTIDAAVAEARSAMGQSGVGSAQMEQVERQLRNQYRISPRIRRVRSDPRTGIMGIWEQVPNDLGGSAATLHVLSRSGVFLATITFPNAWNDFDLYDSRIYALTEDEETGLLNLSSYELVVPEERIPAD